MVDIAICTYNKPQLLLLTLKSILTNTKCFNNILIVDNYLFSIDLKILIESLSNKIIYIYEKQTGLSFARNTGIINSSAEYILFLDDDILLNHDIVSSYLSAIERYPNLVIGGGEIIPIFDKYLQPDWLPSKFNWIYGELKFSKNECTRKLRKNEILNGGNFLIKRELIGQIGYFNTNLGNIGDIQGGNEEHEFINRARKLTDEIYFISNAFVFHNFPKERLTLDYCKKRLENASIDRAKSNILEKKWFEILLRVIKYMLTYINSTPLEKIQKRNYILSILKNLKILK